MHKAIQIQLCFYDDSGGVAVVSVYIQVFDGVHPLYHHAVDGKWGMDSSAMISLVFETFRES